jgi:hypothetical protein
MLALRFMTQSRQGGTPERPSRNALWWATRVIVSSPQLGQQRLCLYQVGGVETFGELGVDRREKVAGFGVAALVAAEPVDVRRDGISDLAIGGLLFSRALRGSRMSDDMLHACRKWALPELDVDPPTAKR